LSKIAAEKLGKENYDNFTSKAWRSSGATEMSNKGLKSNVNNNELINYVYSTGSSMTQIQQAGGWKSDQVPKEYIRDNENMRLQNAVMLQNLENDTYAPYSVPHPQPVMNSLPMPPMPLYPQGYYPMYYPPVYYPPPLPPIMPPPSPYYSPNYGYPFYPPSPFQ
jgi:hypothetical protein